MSNHCLGDKQHRGALKIGIGHGGETIGDTGARGNHGDTDAAGEYDMGRTTALSWRTSMMRTSRCARQSKIGWIWAPCRPKTHFTPRVYPSFLCNIEAKMSRES